MPGPRTDGRERGPGMPGPYNYVGGLRRLAQPCGPLQVDRDELRDAALGHGDAEETVHPRHRRAVMGDDEEARLRTRGDLLDESAEAVDIGVVERRIDLVEHADRCRVGE